MDTAVTDSRPLSAFRLEGGSTIGGTTDRPVGKPHACRACRDTRLRAVKLYAGERARVNRVG